jgi:hypothetical protein
MVHVEPLSVPPLGHE